MLQSGLCSQQSGYLLKKQIKETYFEGQHQFDEPFVHALFQLAQQDPAINELINQQSQTLLRSNHACNHSFLMHLLASPRHHHLAHKFIHELISLKVTTRNRTFELRIMQTLPSILRTTLSAPSTLKTTITYLALKMRSFDLQIRVQAVKTLKELGQNLDGMHREWDVVFKEAIPLMIQKQKLAKSVSYIKGMFLHTLEDEFNQVRQLCIQTLVLFRRYLRPSDLKLIIIYMLNDEHEVVREEALIASKHLKDQTLGKEDIETIMMCLRQKRTNMRKYVYQTLSMASINSPALLLQIIQKTLPTLQNNKSDKKCIYRMLILLGRKYVQWIEGIICQLLAVDQIEPNWKSITYKAKMVVCYAWWEQLPNKDQLPFYFSRHMLYIRDVEPYLFQDDSAMKAEPHWTDLTKMNPAHLISFIQCEEEISQDFHRIALGILRSKLNSETDQTQNTTKLHELTLVYQLKQEQRQIVEELSNLETHGDLYLSLINLVSKCIQNRQQYEEKDEVVMLNKCEISKSESNLVVITKGQAFQERVILRCCLHSLISRQPRVEYKKAVNLAKLREDEDRSYLSLNLTRYTKVECLLVMPDESQRLLDSYSIELKL